MSSLDDFTPPPDTDATGDARLALARVWPYVEVAVEVRAGKLACSQQEREELIQDARVELLRRDATRVDLRSKRALGQLRTVLMNCMQKKSEQRAREDGQWTDEVPDSLRDDLMN